jgi:hypothetical protein
MVKHHDQTENNVHAVTLPADIVISVIPASLFYPSLISEPDLKLSQYGDSFLSNYFNTLIDLYIFMSPEGDRYLLIISVKSPGIDWRGLLPCC